MLTPKFVLNQNDQNLIIKIYAPYAKVSDIEINIDQNVFIFYSSPYYLRLTLPGNLINNEAELHETTFDAEEGAFVIVCKKEENGQHFNGLDMLTQLLTPAGAEGISKPLIEVINESPNDQENGEGKEGEEDEINWFIEQNLPEENLIQGFKYGFANSHSGVFTSLRDELTGVVDVLNPDTKSLLNRRKERILAEKDHFSEDHYLADLFENESVAPYLDFKPVYASKNISDDFTAEEEEALLKLPRKELLIDNEMRLPVFIGLFDIIYSWCYNHRINLGENCSESAWNIKKISSTLSWLDSFTSLKEAGIASMRRSLIYPLTRNWELSNKVMKDTHHIFTLGKKQLVKCLLEIQRLFHGYEPYYLLNQLYITDFCVWIQTVKEEKISHLSDSILKLALTKDDLDLDLVSLEEAAKLVLEEEKSNEEQSNLNNLVNSMDHLSVIQNNFALPDNENLPEDLIGTNTAPVSYVIPISGSCSSTSSDSSSDDSSDDSTSSSDDSDDDSSDESSSDEKEE